MTRHANPEERRRKRDRIRQAIERGVQPVPKQRKQGLRQLEHASNPKAVRTRRDGERKVKPLPTKDQP